MPGCDSLDVFPCMTSGVTYYCVLVIHFFSCSETDTASSDNIFHPIVFCTVFYYLHLFFRALASLWQVRNLKILHPEMAKHGSVVTVLAELQVALPFARLYQIKCWILKISDVICLTKVYKTWDSLFHSLQMHRHVGSISVV